MNEEEKKAIEDIKEEIKGAEDEGHGKDRIIIELKTILNLIEKQQKELEQEKEKNIFLEGYKVGAEEAINELKEKNKELTKQLNGAFDRGFISKDKIKERMEQTKKVYDEEMKPYMIEVGNGEKVLNVTGLNKKEKEELINKKNCLLVQIKTYEMLLEEK